MALDFPSSPTNGQQFAAGGTTWTFDGVKWMAGGSAGNVSNSGTPANGQWAQWTDATHIQGVATASMPFVRKAGDTMTGALHIGVMANPVLYLEKPSAVAGNYIIGSVAATPRWQMQLGDAAVEGTGTAGSDFSLMRCDNAGALLDYPIKVLRANGNVELGGTVNIKAGALYLSGFSAPQVNFTPSSGATRNGQWYQSGDVMYWGVPNVRTAMSLGLGDSGSLVVYGGNAATPGNNLSFAPVAAGGYPQIAVGGVDANVGLQTTTKGTGYYGFHTNSFANLQVIIVHQAAAGYLQLNGGDGGQNIGLSTGGNVRVAVSPAAASNDTSIATTAHVKAVAVTQCVHRYITTSQTVAPTAGVKFWIVEMVGGGAGGGGTAPAAADYQAAGGGGGGGYARRRFTAAEIGAGLAVVIGAGGAGGAPGADGAAGGLTYISGYMQAVGGNGSNNSGAVRYGGQGGYYGSCSGDFTASGNSGGPGFISVGDTLHGSRGGVGGGSYFGGGGYGGAGDGHGSAWGGGGGGAASANGTPQYGANGFQGVCLITEFY